MNTYRTFISKIAFCLAVAVVFTALNGAARAETIWAIVVADTQDVSIGTSTAIDLDNVTQTLGEIARDTGMDLKLQTISGRSLTVKAIGAALNSIEPEADDIVFFYYSGHGERSLASDDPWPNLWVGGRLVAYSEILDRLDDGDPRLVIALSDACNRDAASPYVGASMLAEDDADADKSWSYKGLFEDTTGYFVAASSSPGELSTTIGSGGSAYTKSFLTAVHYAMKTAGATWDDVKDIAGEPIPILSKTNNLHTAYTMMDIRGVADPEPNYPF
jgi:hypothetical protein